MTKLHENKELKFRTNESSLIPIGNPFKIEGSIRAYLIAKCKCGAIKLFLWKEVNNGHTKTCGCGAIEASKKACITHNSSNTNLYNTWHGIKARCYNKNNPSYARYGGNGIFMDESWKNDFVSFKEWAIINKWEKGLNIDRIDNKKGYSPDNCRITTPKQNCRNKTNNIKITYQGSTKILIEWVEYFNLDYSRTIQRYMRGLRGKELFDPKKIPNGKVGRKHTEETKMKMSLAQKGKKMPPVSEERRRKVSEFMKGRKWSEAQIKNHKEGVRIFWSRKKQDQIVKGI